MNQEQTTSTPASLPSQQPNQQKIINVITIITLIFFWPVGLILMWLLTSWRKKTKIIITIAIMLIVILLVGVQVWLTTSSLGEARKAARDAMRKADMRMIATAQEMYYGEDWRYYQSDGTTWPASIGTFMAETPTDPLEDIKTPYVWVNNTGDDQKFCVYATLGKGGWYVASHEGNYECSDVKPTLDDCCF